MNRRFEITDDEWERLAPLLPATTHRRGGRRRDHRQILNFILFRSPQRGPLAGPPRARRAMADGLQAVRVLADRRDLGTVEACLRAEAEAAGELDWDAQIDSTLVRAHQHAAGARKGEHLDPG